jgi:methenyltetrahydrofolate cyclohydrolase
MPEFDSPPQTLREYATAVASSAPTPGGGSVIANVAALAASLAEMVCNLTIGKVEGNEAQTALTAAQQSTSQLRQSFLDFATADEAAYGGYRAAAKLPKSTPAEKQTRQAALEVALSASALVPLHIAEGCLDLLVTLETVAKFGTKHALADAHTSRRFAYAALENALDMVSANTDLMKNRDEASAIDKRCVDLKTQAERAHTKVMTTLNGRRASP